MSEALFLGTLASRDQGEMAPCPGFGAFGGFLASSVWRLSFQLHRGTIRSTEVPSAPVTSQHQVRGATGAAGKALAKGVEELQKARLD